MNEETRPRSGLEHANEALSLLLTALIFYRFTHPDGPEPRELLRLGLERGRAWVASKLSDRRGYLDTLEAIRDLPETKEGPST